MKQQCPPIIIRKRKPSMKRKRPWASCYSASSLVSLGMLLLTVMLTPGVDSSIVFPEEGSDYINSRQQQGNLTKPQVPLESQLEKDFSPFLMDMRLNVTVAVDFNDLLRSLNKYVEFYLFDRLFGYGLDVDDVNIRAVSLQVTLLVRRRRQLQLSASNTKVVTVEIDGATHYEVDVAKLDAKQVKEDVNTEIEKLLTLEKVGQYILDSNIDNVVDVQNITIKKYYVEEDDDATTATLNPTANQQDDNDVLEKPSTLSIVFGFALLGLVVLSLFGYAWLFWNKRKKRLAKQEQLKNSIPIHHQTLTNNKVSPNQPIAGPYSKQPFHNNTKVQQEEKDQQQVDSFARELDEDTASQQPSQGGWSNFLDLNEDSSQQPLNFLDPNNDSKEEAAAPYSPYGKNYRAEEKKEDTWGTSSAFSAETSEGFDVSHMSHISATSNASSEASSMALEVQKLSRYVQRYEQRKERRTVREAASKSQASSSNSDLDMDYLKRVKANLNTPTRTRSSAAYSDATSAVRDNTTLKRAGDNLASQLLGKSKFTGGDTSNYTKTQTTRLGISPFKQNLASFDNQEEASQNEHRRTKSDGDRPAYSNLKSLRNYQAIMDNKKRLADLRSNSAIIDSSKSDVNIGALHEEEEKPFSTKSKPSSMAAAPKPFSTKPTARQIASAPDYNKPRTPPRNNAPSKPHLLVLISKMTTNPQDRANQDMITMMVKSNGFEDYEVLDGSNLKFKDRRNELFEISGHFAKYPQVFVVYKDDEPPTFVGDFDTCQQLNDAGQLTSRFLFSPSRANNAGSPSKVQAAKSAFESPNTTTTTTARRFSSPKVKADSNSKFSSARSMFEKKSQQSSAVLHTGQRLF